MMPDPGVAFLAGLHVFVGSLLLTLEAASDLRANFWAACIVAANYTLATVVVLL